MIGVFSLENKTCQLVTGSRENKEILITPGFTSTRSSNGIFP
jgi:hypothetical protein